MKLKITIIIGVILGLGILSSILWFDNTVHVTYHNTTQTQFQISPGESTSDILDHLVEKRLIKNKPVAFVYVYMHHAVFVPGVFDIPDQYTWADLLKVFSKEPQKDHTVTIPEGWNKLQIAEALDAKGLPGSQFLALAKLSEGMLFPDTYSIDNKTTVSDVYNRMIDQYNKKTKDLHGTISELILASIVEREAKTDTDRPIIAGIYKHRLAINMALEADPTVQYAKYVDLGKAPIKDGKKNYWAPITKSDYTDVKSPYNTYLYRGLPPGPICNPGEKSLKAVVTAQRTDALYFFHTASGELITSRTLDEHNANKARYLK